MGNREELRESLEADGFSGQLGASVGLMWETNLLLEACEQLRDLMLLLSVDGIILFCNTRFATAMGVRKEDLLDKSIFALPLPLRTRDEWEYLFSTVVSSGMSTTVNTHSFTVQEERVYETTARPLRQDEHIIGVSCICRDITEIKAMAAELELHQRMVEGFLGITFSVSLDLSSYNLRGQVESITGYTAYELSDGSIPSGKLIHPDDLEIVRNAANELANSLRPVTHCRFRLIRKDGTIRWVHAIGTAISDRERTPTGAQGVLYDITDYVRHRERTWHLKAVLDMVRDIVIVSTMDGQIIEANEAALAAYGYSLTELIALNTTALCVDRYDPTVCDAIENGNLVEMTHIRKNGSRFPVEISSLITSLDDRKVYVHVIRDISRRKAAQQEIARLKDKDLVTGAYSSHYLKLITKRLQATGTIPASMLVLDINGFKQVNDDHGIDTGDQVLKGVAECLQQVIGNAGTVARIGGDEFGIVIPGADSATASSFSQQIRNTISERLGPTINMAIGAATKRFVQEDLFTTWQEAEERMLFNKLSHGDSILNSIIASLSASLYEKSNETEAHTTRLQYYARLIGQRLQLNEYESDELNLLAKLHDIGKIGVPETILNKPGGLTDAEWLIMKQHPEMGYRIARTVSALSPIAGSILSHHERWDGSGYPSGLAGRDIPVLARIISIVDAYDVMVSGRPYQRPKTHGEALQELMNQSGRQFDPTLVKIFVEAIKEEQLD